MWILLFLDVPQAYPEISTYQHPVRYHALVESAALLGKGRVPVTGDSGLLRIAAGLGTPTVSLFGPSDPANWGPRGEEHVAFASRLACAPCSRFGAIPPCACHGGCLAAIAPRQVADAVVRLWERRPDNLFRDVG